MENKERVVVEWVLKVKIEYDHIILKLILRHTQCGKEEKEYETMEKIARVFSKIYNNIPPERIRNILMKNIRDMFYSHTASDYVHKKIIKIDDKYHDKLKEYVQNIREDVLKAMSEIYELNKLINEAKSTIPPEYILYSEIN